MVCIIKALFIKQLINKLINNQREIEYNSIK
jgi:hypothetical protein